MAKLTSKARKAIPTKEFAVPSERKYPIEDAAHGRNALARVSQHGSPEEKAKVRSAVHRKFPDIVQSKDTGGMIDGDENMDADIENNGFNDEKHEGFLKRIGKILRDRNDMNHGKHLGPGNAEDFPHLGRQDLGMNDHGEDNF